MFQFPAPIRHKFLFIALCSVGACLGTSVSAAPKTTTVTTYVTTVQDEREQTRWTLTEWLKIKERMRMMDLWLAMFSDPKKDRFQPELMLSYGMTRGTMEVTTGPTKDSASLAGNTGRAQLWLTNLVSSTIGIRTLNIDLGGEAYQRQTGDFIKTAAVGSIDTVGASSGKLRTRAYTGNLRIFGRNVQDSSLVLKYGRYDTVNSIASLTKSGAAAGAEMNLYVFKWLGLEGTYMHYGDAKSARGNDTTQIGSYYDYQAYIEISLLRFSGGPYREDWTTVQNDTEIKTTEKGYVGNVKLSF